MSAPLTDTVAPNRLTELLSSAALFSTSSSPAPLVSIDLAPGDGSSAGSAGPTVDSSAQHATELLNDALQPVLGADGGAAPLPGLLGSLTNADGVPETLSGVLAPSEATGDATPLDLAGDGTTAQPVFDAANAAILDFHAVLENLSHQTGTSDVVHGVTNLGETVGLGEIGSAASAAGNTNLVTDLLNLPGDTLAGGVDAAVSNIGNDLTDVVHATFDLGNAVLNGTDPLNPIPELINGLGSDLQSQPLLTLGNGDGTGLLNGGIGDLSQSSSGHVVDVGVDGLGIADGLALNLLATPDGSSPIDVNAIDVGSGGPQLVDLQLDTDSGLLGGSGAGVPDALGDLAGLGAITGLGDGGSNPLLTINGGNDDASGALLGGVVGDFSGSSTGHLADADVAGLGTQPLALDALASPSASDSSVDANVVDVGPSGAQLVDLGLDTQGGLLGSGAADDHGILALNGTQII